MRRALLHGATLGLCLTLAPCAFAQPPGRLAEVEQAYADVDYERTLTLAGAALRSGGNDRATTAQLYVLLATSAAALDQNEDARAAFARALAANPELKLERSLSPKIRGPYLEARGAMAGNGDKLPLELTLRHRKRALELILRDTLHVAGSISLATRVGEQGPFARQKLVATPVQRIAVGSATVLQYFVQVLDEHRNVLFELGSEDDPATAVAGEHGAAERAPAFARDRSSSNGLLHHLGDLGRALARRGRGRDGHVPEA
jgi:hypothetical protein